MRYIQDPIAFNRYLFANCHCVNAGQSQEERRLKYAIARTFGKSRPWAVALRDYRKTTFARFFGYSSWESLIKFIKE